MGVDIVYKSIPFFSRTIREIEKNIDKESDSVPLTLHMLFPNECTFGDFYFGIEDILSLSRSPSFFPLKGNGGLRSVGRRNGSKIIPSPLPQYFSPSKGMEGYSQWEEGTGAKESLSRSSSIFPPQREQGVTPCGKKKRGGGKRIIELNL